MRTELSLITFTALLVSCVGCAARPALPEPAPVGSVQPSQAAEKTDTITIGYGRSRTASSSAQDWVTYADHVVVVTVVEETRGQPSKTEIERQEGLVPRRAVLRVDEVLWSSPKPAQAAPESIEENVAGWVFNDNNGEGGSKFAIEGHPRLELSHSYVRALDWVDDPCSADPKDGHWAGLGEGGTIPYDNGILGAGEFEGNVYTVDEAKEHWQNQNMPGLRDQVLGQTTEALVEQLNSATPRRANPVGSTECDLTDR